MLGPLSLVLGVVPNISRELVYILARMESEALVPLVKCDFFDKMSLKKNDFCKKNQNQTRRNTITHFDNIRWLDPSIDLSCKSTSFV